LDIAVRQKLRDGVLAVSHASLTAAAQRYLRDRFDASAAGILAGEGLLEEAREGLETLGTRFEKL
jgi:hypothetical protein